MPYGIPQSTWNMLPAEDRAAIAAASTPVPATPPPTVDPAPPPPTNVAPAPPPPPVVPATVVTPPYAAGVDASSSPNPTYGTPPVLTLPATVPDVTVPPYAAGVDVDTTPNPTYGTPPVLTLPDAAPPIPPEGYDGGIAPPIDVQEWGHDDQGDYELLGDFPELDGYELLSVDTIRGQAFIDYVKFGCTKRALDVLAVLANAYHEGLAGGIGDGGTSYGPWQLHDGGALPKQYWYAGKNVPRIQSWAWSKAGIDYALDAMATTSAVGKYGDAAVRALVFEFERPSDKQGQYIARLATYYAFRGQGEKIWAQLAKYVNGAKPITGTTIKAPVAKPTQVKMLGTWRDLIAVLRDDVPAAGTHMQNAAKRLEGKVT